MKMYNKRNQDLPLDHYLVMEVAINPQKGRLLMSLESKGVNSGSYLARNKISVCHEEIYAWTTWKYELHESIIWWMYRMSMLDN